MEIEEMNKTVKDWQQTAEENAETLKQRAQHWRVKAQEKARLARDQADHYVHENAWTSLLVVAVAAGVVGFYLGRRS